MDKIRVDLDEIITAQDHQGPELQSFLDLETGKIVMWMDPDYVGEVDDMPPLEELEDDPRYLLIPPRYSSNDYATMEEFTNELPTSRLKARLIEALSGRKPFRAFKDALLYDLAVREQWFEFERREQLYWAERWLREEDVDAETYDSFAETQAKLRKEKG